MHRESLQRIARDDRIACHAGFWWGLAEGLFFFIVPDVYISFATLFSLRAGVMAWLTSIAGSTVAIAILYVLMIILGIDYLAFLEWVPGISDRLLARAGQSVGGGGQLPYTPLLILAGVPLKVYAGLAFSMGASLGSALLWTVFARLVRIAPTVAAFAIIHILCRRRIEARPRAWSAALGFFWLAFYAFYFVRMSRV